MGIESMDYVHLYDKLPFHEVPYLRISKLGTNEKIDEDTISYLNKIPFQVKLWVQRWDDSRMYLVFKTVGDTKTAKKQMDEYIQATQHSEYMQLEIKHVLF